MSDSRECRYRRALGLKTEQGQVRLWDAHTGELKRTLVGHQDGVLNVSFSPHGQLVASMSFDETIKVWNAQTGELKHTLTGDELCLVSFSFSPDGRILATSSTDTLVRLWKLSDVN